MSTPTISLQEKYKELKNENPKIRARQAADELGISEAELLASSCDGEDVVRLQGPWADLIKQIESLGYVMALTRNEWAVHEKKGYYKNFKFTEHSGVVHNGNIDLRIFQGHFAFGFAAPVENPRGTLHSLQFFEAGGAAIHKVYLMEPDKSMDAYKGLIEAFRHPDQSPAIATVSAGQSTPSKNNDVDIDALLDDWAQLKSTHGFYPMIRNHKLARLQTIQLGKEKFTREVSTDSTAKMLDLAVAREVPIMAFVGSRGVVQIHSGKIKNVKPRGPWLNIMDSEFNLHLREDVIAHSWIVEKPTVDGTVTSLEVFDEDENLIANFFGEREPGIPELESWREILKELN